MARRFARDDEEARDLAQDALVAALARGFTDWASAERRPWLYGVLRRRAAFVARTAARRNKRERVAPQVTHSRWMPPAMPPTMPPAMSPTMPPGMPPQWRPQFVAALPPSLRVVATLAGADLCAAEVRWLLGLTPTAWRSRLSALRRAIRDQAAPCTQPHRALSGAPASSWGARRATLLAGLKATRLPMVAAHDPDGHAIFLRAVPHTRAKRGNQ